MARNGIRSLFTCCVVASRCCAAHLYPLDAADLLGRVLGFRGCPVCSHKSTWDCNDINQYLIVTATVMGNQPARAVAYIDDEYIRIYLSRPPIYIISSSLI